MIDTSAVAEAGLTPSIVSYGAVMAAMDWERAVHLFEQLQVPLPNMFGNRFIPSHIWVSNFRVRIVDPGTCRFWTFWTILRTWSASFFWVPSRAIPSCDQILCM